MHNFVHLQNLKETSTFLGKQIIIYTEKQQRKKLKSLSKITLKKL